jgi:SPP1 gp7 family putative phage head morphogenesis protein
MTWTATADPARFDEAVEWFRQRLPLTDDIIEKLGEMVRLRAFRIAGVAQLDVVQAIYDILLELLNSGGSLGDFKARAREKLEREWGRSDSFRVETIYRNAAQHAYNAGRWRQQQHPAIRRHRPYKMFDAVLDGRETDICRKRNKTVLPADHPWWETNTPQLHHRCRSATRMLTPRQAEARGIATEADLRELPGAGDGFGAIPREDDWEPDASKYSPELWAQFADKQEQMSR